MINQEEKIFLFQRILFYAIPFALVSGPFLSDLFSVIISGIFIYYVILTKDFFYFKNYFSLFFILWWLILIISSIISEYPTFSFETSLVYIRHYLFAIAIYFIIKCNPISIKYFTISLITIFSLLVVDGYFQYFIGTNLIGFEYNNNRLSSLFGDELILGNFLSRLFPLLFALVTLTVSGSKRYIYLTLILFIASDVLIYISGERTAFLLLLLSTLIIIVSIKRWQKIRVFSFAISIILIFLISLFNSNISQRMITQTMDQISPKSDEVYIFSKQHESHYISSLEMFLDFPVLGVGPNNFRNKCKDYSYNAHESDFGNNLACSTHPHNTYVQLFAETGIIGTLPIIFLFLFLSYYLLQNLYRKLTKNANLLSDFQVCLWATVFVTLWPIIPTMNFFHNWISIIYFLPIGFLLYSYEKPNIELTK